MLREKTCSNCESTLKCGDTLAVSCWCNQYPPIFELDSNNDCLCKRCLHEKSLIKIQEYIAQIKIKGLKYNIAPKLSQNSSLIEELDYYNEDGYLVFTEWYHLKRGNCCRNGCRHCPY
jgi:hypothetical protein